MKNMAGTLVTWAICKQKQPRVKKWLKAIGWFWLMMTEIRNSGNIDKTTR